jgi:hypothetical protein
MARGDHRLSRCARRWSSSAACPDALIVTDDDILQDEGEAYAAKLGRLARG